MQNTRQQPGVVERVPLVAEAVAPSGADDLAAELEMAWSRFALRFLRSPWNSPPAAIGITSTVRGEGRTTGSVALAISLAKETALPVALVGADFHGYGLAEAFGMQDAPNVEGVLRGELTMEAALSETPVPGLALLPARAGHVREHIPAKLFWPALRRRLPELVAGLKRNFAYTVYDLPPLLDNAEASDFAREMDALVMLTRTGVTPLPKLEEALALVDGERLVGAVHTGASGTLPRWVTALLLE